MHVASGCEINSHLEGGSSRPKGTETLAHSVGKICIIVFLMMVSISIPGYQFTLYFHVSLYGRLGDMLVVLVCFGSFIDNYCSKSCKSVRMRKLCIVHFSLWDRLGAIDCFSALLAHYRELL